MRCEKCNVDLPENYTRCPLCGSKPINNEAKIKNLKAVPYSDSAVEHIEKAEKVKTDFTFEKIKAYFNL